MPDWERQRVRNDDSIVLELRWRDVSVLLTGDIGRAVERDAAVVDSARAPAHRQGAAPRQPDVELAGIRPRAGADASRSSAPAGRTTSGIPVPEVLERYRAGRGGGVSNRSGRGGDGRYRWTLDRRCTTFTGRTGSSRMLPRKHEDTKITKDTKMTTLRIALSRFEHRARSDLRSDRTIGVLHRTCIESSGRDSSRAVYAARRRLELAARGDSVRSARSRSRSTIAASCLCHQRLDLSSSSKSSSWKSRRSSGCIRSITPRS